jgi:hypothetical protein
VPSRPAAVCRLSKLLAANPTLADATVKLAGSPNLSNGSAAAINIRGRSARFMLAMKRRLRLLGVRVGSLAKPGQTAAARKRRPAAGQGDTAEELPFERSDVPATP